MSLIGIQTRVHRDGRQELPVGQRDLPLLEVYKYKTIYLD